MKYNLKATDDVNETYGNLVMNVDKGKTIEFSATDAEIALRTGKFEVAEEIPTTDFEKEAAKLEAEKAKLLSNNKDALVTRATKINKTSTVKIDTSLNKEPLAEAIIEAENPGKDSTIKIDTSLNKEPLTSAIIESGETSADK